MSLKVFFIYLFVCVCVSFFFFFSFSFFFCFVFKLWQPFCSADQNHFINFGKRAQEEHCYEIILKSTGHGDVV